LQKRKGKEVSVKDLSPTLNQWGNDLIAVQRGVSWIGEKGGGWVNGGGKKNIKMS